MMKFVVLLACLFITPAIAEADRHVCWVKHTTSTVPAETWKADLLMIKPDMNGQWLVDHNNTLCDLWLAPNKAYVVGRFRVQLEVVPLAGGKAVCGIVDPEVSDFTNATRMRWKLKLHAANAGKLYFLGNARFPTTITIPHNNGAWIYGLHGLIGLHTRVPPGGYYHQSTPDIISFAECSYKVGGFKLRFDRRTVRPGVSAVSVKDISMSLWKKSSSTSPYQYTASNDAVSSIKVAMFVAVQRTGDANFDGYVNGLDVDDFVLAMSDSDAYQEKYHNVPAYFNCDMNDDGMVNGLDTGLFMKAIVDGGIDDYWRSVGL